MALEMGNWYYNPQKPLWVVGVYPYIQLVGAHLIESAFSAF